MVGLVMVESYKNYLLILNILFLFKSVNSSKKGKGPTELISNSKNGKCPLDDSTLNALHNFLSELGSNNNESLKIIVLLSV